jgi:hypothetical protein
MKNAKSHFFMIFVIEKAKNIMRKYTLVWILLAILLFTACKHKTLFKEVQAPGKFTMQLPEYMQATSELYNEGKYCMQYESDSMKVYLLVFDTSRENLNEKSLNDYYDSIIAGPTSQGASVAPPKSVFVNKDSTLQTEMTITLNKTPVYYRIEVIATPRRFYYISLWCTMDKKEEREDDFDKIMESFRDIGK